MVAKNNKGQSILEFLVFLPLFLMFIGLIVGVGNSINGSINLQKATRGYFYYSAQNNSFIPRPDYGNQNPHLAWRNFGMFFIGWFNKIENNLPVAPCFRIPLPLSSSDTACDNAYSDRTTQNIRVGSVYGICGATFFNSGNHVYLAPFVDPNGGGQSISVSAPESCLIQ